MLSFKLHSFYHVFQDPTCREGEGWRVIRTVHEREMLEDGRVLSTTAFRFCFLLEKSTFPVCNLFYHVSSLCCLSYYINEELHAKQ